MTQHTHLVRATATPCCDNDGLSVDPRDPTIVMSARERVDAVLIGFARDPRITIPSLNDSAKE
ncbi:MULTISPECIES: hypothetical protein [Leclercia]|uniref:hypothetical protein n=1 Tax=Leclercia TaxID=83654 RepID=UPI000CD03E93|nr:MULTISPECIES: hypothetical protein [Leclercia]POV34026.1 hypothetical protein C3388_12195 [Leclercia sp. LSNIH5]POW66452.1 hypothetical protein C3389_09185 [Leclercia sp. LSNIH2]AUU85352.1 hypothetical protein C2U54_15595 [Leclercia sp. LSNIH1]MCZ7840884.1 hypothetical protein [Leclercia adecarboxylata]QVV59996.1 hypothetical protein JV208_09620 [Leclercia sp. Colony189]